MRLSQGRFEETFTARRHKYEKEFVVEKIHIFIYCYKYSEKSNHQSEMLVGVNCFSSLVHSEKNTVGGGANLVW